MKKGVNIKMKIFEILLLDDDINDLILIENFFQPIGGIVTFTENVKDAVNILESANPTLSLISLKLAHTDNWYLLKQIRKNLVPIIGLSEQGHAFWMKEGRLHGINAYLEKPLDCRNIIKYLPSALAQAWAFNKNRSNVGIAQCLR